MNPKSLSLTAYHEAARQTATGEPSLERFTLGLCEEAGEVAGKVKRLMRGDDPAPLPGEFAKELGDVLWYLAMVADELGYTLEDIARMNMAKLRRRLQEGLIAGSGDDR